MEKLKEMLLEKQKQGIRINTTSIEKFFCNNDEIEEVKRYYSLSFKGVCWHLLNNVDFYKHQCEVCGKELDIDKLSHSFPTTCSKECARKSSANQKKREKIFLQKYGVKNPSQLKEVKEKKIKTSLKKYGVENPSQSIEIKEKKRQSIQKKYQADCFFQTEDYRKEVFKKILLKFQKTGEERGFTFLSTEEDFVKNNSNGVYRWKCNKCGEIFNSHYGNRNVICRKCHPPIISHGHEEVISFIREELEIKNIKINDRSIIAPLEIDIFLPDYNIGIEYNGLYWHSSLVVDKNYHINKTEKCEEQGIKLIHSYDKEWENKKDIIKQRLRHLLKKKVDTVFARKCKILEIDSKKKNSFLEQYHLQGKDSSKIKIGLFYKEEMVAIMTFGKPRFNSKYEWELIRFCSSCVVVGGASKLLSYFKKTYSPKSIITYADRKWSSGNLYEKIGFDFLRNSEPSYFYIKNEKNEQVILSRYECQKHKIKSFLGEDNFNENLTEQENMINNRFFQVYDCGNKVYIWIDKKQSC